MLIDRDHKFTNAEINQIIQRVDYLKVKLHDTIESTVFIKTITSLQQHKDGVFGNLIPIEKYIKELCTVLAEKAPDFLQELTGARKVDGSKFSPKELFDMAKGIIVIKHKKDILNILSPGGLFFTQYGLELEQALYTTFSDLKIPCKVPIIITFHGVETDRKTHPIKKSCINPSKTIQFDHTQFGSYEETAKRIINLLDNESFIEHNMKYMSGSWHRLEMNSINISIDASKEIDKDSRSFETRESIVNKMKKIYNFIDSQSSISNDAKAFDVVYDTLNEIKESKKFNDSQKEYIFQKTKGMIINTLVDNGSTLYIGYGNIDKGGPKKELYIKYNVLHNLLKHIEHNKGKDAVYMYIDRLLSLLENDNYHDFNYDNYKPGYLASKQKSVINGCKILKMIKKTETLQKF